MRRSTIALFLLLWLPSSAPACFDEHKNVEFLDEKTPSRSWEIPGTSAEEFHWQEAVRVCVIAVVSASVALSAIWLPVTIFARRRGRMNPIERDIPAPPALPLDWPTDRSIRVDEGHDRSGPISMTIIREDAVSPLVG